MDVVYNHTYLSRDSHLNIIVPGYYYRQDATLISTTDRAAAMNGN